MARYWLGPWAWVLTDGAGAWQAPTGTQGALDLRAPHQCALAGGAPEGLGLFVTANATNLGAGYTNLGTDPDALLNSSQRSAWEALFELPAALAPGVSLQEALYETLTLQADPLGDRCLPLVPTASRRFEVWLTGQRISNRAFDLTGPEAPPLQDLLRREYRALRTACLAGELPEDLYKKVLGYWRRKLRVAREWLQPVDLQGEEDLPPETTLTDDWNRADSNPASNAAAGWAWQGTSTEPPSTTINFKILSNYLTVGNGSGLTDVRLCRAESSLSGSDNYGQVDVTFYVATSRIAAVACRFSSAAETCYYYQVDGGGASRIYKRVTGTDTALGTASSVAVSVPDTLRITANGSSISSTWNGVADRSLTDTAIVSGLRAGVGANRDPDQVRLDNFEGADLAVATKAPPVFRHSWRFWRY